VRGENLTLMAAVRITSGPLRGVELETALLSPPARVLRMVRRMLGRRRPRGRSAFG
jgi:hypothetical protein